MSKTRLTVLGLAAMLLAACGPVHPGAAAVVDGTRISFDDVDDIASVYCTASLSGGGGSAAGIDTIGLRRQSLADLLVGEVADQIADDRGFEVPVDGPTDDDRAQLAEMFGDQLDAALAVIARNQRTNAISVQMAREADPSLTDEQSLAQAGQQLLVEALSASDVAVDPRFGLDETLQQLAETGSLSVREVALDDTAVEDRPAALQCSA